MINHRIAHRARALPVFVQQLSHLLDRERRILPVKRLLTFTLIEEGPILGVRAAGDLFVRLRGIAGTARRASCISRTRISDRALPPAPRHSAVSTTPISLIQAKLDFLLFSSVSLENNGQMSEHIYKKIELVGSSPNGFEEAVKNALARAEKTVRNMRWFEVAETRGYIENGKIAHWQVTLKVGFTLEDA
jgi:dodecin